MRVRKRKKKRRHFEKIDIILYLYIHTHTDISWLAASQRWSIKASKSESLSGRRGTTTSEWHRMSDVSIALTQKTKKKTRNQSIEHVYVCVLIDHFLFSFHFQCARVCVFMFLISQRIYPLPSGRKRSSFLSLSLASSFYQITKRKGNDARPIQLSEAHEDISFFFFCFLFSWYFLPLLSTRMTMTFKFNWEFSLSLS